MRMMRSMFSGLVDEAGDHHGIGHGRHLQRGVGKRRPQHHFEFLGVAEDDHVDGVEFLVFAPEIDLGHARRLRRHLNLVGRQGRQFEDVGIVHLGLGNLLLHGEDAAGVDRHLQPLAWRLDLEDHRRFGRAGWKAGSANAASGQNAQIASGMSSRPRDRVHILVFLA